MLGYRVEFDGEQFLDGLDALADRVGRATPPAINEILREVQQVQRRLLNLGAHPRGTRTGSKAPAPPWRVSGAMIRRVRVDRADMIGPHMWEGKVGPTSVYGRIHELGGFTGRGHRTYLPPRPSLKPAWTSVRPRMGHTFRRHWAAAAQAR